MRGWLFALIVALAAAPAAAQHSHSTEALTATPAFARPMKAAHVPRRSP